MRKKLFVDLPVAGVDRSIALYRALGLEQNHRSRPPGRTAATNANEGEGA